MPVHSCSACDYSTSLKADLEKHLKTLKHLRKVKGLEEVALLEANDEQLKANNDLKQNVDKLKDTIRALEATIVEQAAQLALAKPLLEKAVTRPTRVTTTNNLNLLSSEPIDWAGLRTRVPELLNAESVMTSENKFNGMIAKELLMDSDGNPKVVCSDRSRKQFQYKDEKNGELISDPCLERLRERLKAGVNYKLLYRELLEHLDSYGGDKSENPQEATNFLKRARFETGFVNYVAKRMYSRSLAKVNFLDG